MKCGAMKCGGAWIGLAPSLLGCAVQAGGLSVAAPTGGQRPAWQEQMEQARRMAAARYTGYNYVLVVRPVREEASDTGGVWVFYNNPRPVLLHVHDSKELVCGTGAKCLPVERWAGVRRSAFLAPRGP